MWINRVLLQSARRSPALRTASSFSTELRGLPQYQVFGEDCMLSLKMILPVFRVLRNQQTMVVDNRGKGKILLEWTPRLAEGMSSGTTVLIKAATVPFETSTGVLY